METTDNLKEGGKTASILLVEDNPADANPVREALEEHGVAGEVTIFTDGEKAIQFIRALDTQRGSCPDLAIIDMNLPRRPGREVLECMRKSERCREVTAVVLSSSAAQQDRMYAALLGVSKYLRKPSRLEEFLGLGAIFKDLLGNARR